MAILRKERRDHYTVIDNTVFFDYSLSYKAKGLLCQMLSLPDGWSFSIEGLTRFSTDGKASVMSALNELKDAGYFYRVQLREGNRISGVEYVISETKSADFQDAENQHAEKQNAENQTLLNTNILNTNKSNTKDIHIDHATEKPKKGNLHSNPSLRPTLEEVEAYAREKSLNIDTKFFYDFFTEGEWVDSEGKPVQSWKQKLITWSKQNDIRRSNKKREGIRGSADKERDSVGNGEKPSWVRPIPTAEIF